NRNTDTPLPPEEPAGQNPPDGAMIDYYLTAKSKVTLEIFDAAGKSVRRYSSDDKPDPVEERELNVPAYWVRMPKTFSGEPGMHPWSWDLRLRPPDAVTHEYPISAIYHDTPRYPLGPWVMPGQYTVKLTVDGKTYSQPLTVKMDPRCKTPLAGLTQQFTLSTKVWSAMNESYAANAEMRKLGRENDPSALSKLNGQLSRLLKILQNSAQTPTTQAATAVAELRKSLDALPGKPPAR